MRGKLAGLALGLIFGIVLAWSGLSSPVIIRQALLFQHAYLFLLFASAVLVGSIGLELLRRARGRALLVPTAIAWTRERIERRHIVGSLIFGVGWGIADSCPGPIANQIGQGVLWGLPTFAGVVVGVSVFLARTDRETEPAVESPRGHAELAAR
jgi:uncharacterized protein